MRASGTIGVGLPYQIDRVTLAVGPSFCYISHVNARQVGLPYQAGQVIRSHFVNVTQTRNGVARS